MQNRKRTTYPKEPYFDWLVNIVEADEVRDICKFIDEIEFFCVDPMDEARRFEGNRLREDFLYNTPYTKAGLRDHGGKSYCTFFEFLVGFSLKIESDIMYNRDYGDRVSVWFHLMLENLLNNVEESGNWDQLREVIFSVMNKETPLFDFGPTWSQSPPTYWMAANAYFIRVSE